MLGKRQTRLRRPGYPLYTATRSYALVLNLCLLSIIYCLLPTISSVPPIALAQDEYVGLHSDGKHLATPDGRPLFVLGYNYEGPPDRAWQMWERFDAALIEADFARARSGGANTLRIFVQQPLPTAILAGDFAMLDAVVAAAARQNLYLLLTLADYGERDLAQINAVNSRIATRYRNNPTILAYDLRNEPQFLTLATATYPAGADVPLQGADLTSVYGERLSLADIPAWRTGDEGRVLPAAWSDQQAYAYANNLAYYREFIRAAEQWVLAAGSRNILDFPAAPEAASWQPLWQALDTSLAAWIGTQHEAIRAADPDRLLTVGWSSLLLARLPANRQLDVVALHRFPNPGSGGVEQTLELAERLRQAHDRPLLLEEIGYSTYETDPEAASALEIATALAAYSRGQAGFLKWMLTDLPPVGDPREDNFGALYVDYRPKPSYLALGALGTYLAAGSSLAGDLVVWNRDDGYGFSYLAPDAIMTAGPEAEGPLGFRFATPGQVFLSKRGALYLTTTQPGEVRLQLREIFPIWSGGAPVVERQRSSSWEPLSAAFDGATLTLAAQTGVVYRVRLPGHLDLAAPRSGCRYFAETGHNLCGAFLRYWEANGGLAIFGYPLSEEFAELNRQDGVTYTVQYFERNRFEYHPEYAGSPAEVLLGLLGNTLTAQRRSEPPFRPVVTAAPERDLYPETGHSLGGAFRDYWQANGGLAVFGYPLSEEFSEVNPTDGRVYTVQYFERNRFEFHPEQTNPAFRVQLGLLGNQVVAAQGWR